jgi:hypothetical protein
MVRRHRARADIFNPSSREHWIVVENPWRKMIESERLPRHGSAAALLDAASEVHDGGWTLHEFTSDWPQFYAHKDGEQRYVMITSIDPALPKPERGNLIGLTVAAIPGNLSGVVSAGTLCR